MDRSKLFNTSSPYKLGNLSCKILTPLIGTNNTYMKKDGSVEKLVQNISEENFENGVSNAAGYIDVCYTSKGNRSPHIYIPKIPIYCDVKAIPVAITEADVVKTSFVAPHYVFNQPFIYPKDTDGFLTMNPLQDAPTADTPFMKVRRNGVETSGIATDYLFQYITKYDVGDSANYLKVAAYKPDVALSTESCLLNDTDAISEGAIYIEELEVFKIAFVLTGSAQLKNMVIRYAIIPLTQYASTNQSDILTDKFGNKVSGSQSVALVPIKAMASSAFETVENTPTIDTFNCAIEYAPRNENYISIGEFDDPYPYGHVLSDGEHTASVIHHDTTSSLYASVFQVSVYVNNQATYKYQFCFGVKTTDSNRVAYPINYSPINLPLNLPGTTLLQFFGNSPEELASSYPILDIQKVVNTSRELSYLIKIGIDDANVLKDMYEYSSGCGYFYVHVTSTTLGNINGAYDISGKISSHRVCESYIVKKDKVFSTAIVNKFKYLDEIPNVIIGKFDSQTPPKGDTSLRINEIGKKLENIPRNHLSAVCTLYSGSSSYLEKKDAINADFWDGHSLKNFSTTIDIDGHGEASIYGSSHLLNCTKFPLIFPSPVFYSKEASSKELEVKAKWNNSDKGWAVSFDLTGGDTIPSKNYVASMYLVLVRRNQIVSSKYIGYSWYLDYLKTANEHHLSLHSIDFLEIGHHPYDIKRRRTRYDNSYCAKGGVLRGLAGCLNLYSTPVIGDGGVPLTANFVKSELGLDFTRYKEVAGTQQVTFENKQLLVSDHKVYVNNSIYSRMTDTSQLYELLLGREVENLYVITNYLFVQEANRVSLYSEYNRTVSLVVTLDGMLMEVPAQEADKMYFALHRASNEIGKIFLYQVSQEGCQPIFQTWGSKAILACDNALGTSLNVFHEPNNQLFIYAIADGTVVYRGRKDYVVDIVSKVEGELVSCVSIYIDEGTVRACVAKLDNTIRAFEIESSEFGFPATGGDGLLVYGIKFLFDNDIHEDLTFNFEVVVDNEYIYYIDEPSSEATEKIFYFAPCPAKHAKYKVTGCNATIRGIRWLVYRIPSVIYNQLYDIAKVKELYVIGNTLFVSYDNLTIAYMKYGQSVSKVSTINGKLMQRPIEDEDGTYFIVKILDQLIVYNLTKEGAIPVYETTGEKAVLSTELKNGITVSIMVNDRVDVYSIVRGNFIFKGRLLSTPLLKVVNLITEEDGDVVSCIIERYLYSIFKIYTRLASTTELQEYDISSSEFIFPPTPGYGMLIYGIKLYFDKQENKTFDIDVALDDGGDSYTYSSTNNKVDCEVSLTFPGRPATYGSWHINNCTAPLRAVRWLAHRLPIEIYDLVLCSYVESIYNIGSYVFVDLGDIVLIYMLRGQSANKIATIKGQLQQTPIEDTAGVYFVMKENDLIKVYYLNNEGVIPIHQCKATKGLLSTELETGITVSLLKSSSVEVYSIDRDNFIYRGVMRSSQLFDIVDIVSTGCGSITSTKILQKSIVFGHDYYFASKIVDLDTLHKFEIESSEFIMPMFEGDKNVIFGIKIFFDYDIKDSAVNKFDLGVYVNKKLHHTVKNERVYPEVVIRFNAMPASYARYNISNCLTPIRAVKWLVYKMPLINKTITNN